MDIFWKVIVSRESFVLKSFFQFENEPFELFLETCSDKTQKLNVSKNGAQTTEFPTLEIDSLRKQLLRKNELLRSNQVSFTPLFTSTAVEPLVILGDNSVIGLAFQTPNFSLSLDETFQRLMKCEPFGNAWCTMQLVETGVHTAIPGFAHSGSVAQWKAYFVESKFAPGKLFYED
jgi:hypothetical protein